MKILFFANTEWYLYNFRLPPARYLRDHGHEVVMLSPPGPYIARLAAIACCMSRKARHRGKKGTEARRERPRRVSIDKIPPTLKGPQAKGQP